jgi:hypothetical protein
MGPKSNRTGMRSCGLALALALGGLAGAVADSGAPVAKEVERDRGFAASGEIREHEDGSITVIPWSPRLPSRLNIKTSVDTRYLRQSKGSVDDLQVGDLVLVVEQPPNAEERRSRRARDEALKKKRRPALLPARIARARAVLRCWKGPASVGYEQRVTAKALLNGALPFFRGSSRGGVKPPGEDTPLAVGTITSLEPLALDTPNGPVRYSLPTELLVIDHLPESPMALKPGQTVLIRSSESPGEENEVVAEIVAISPRPWLPAMRERRLILRERKKSAEGGGG